MQTPLIQLSLKRLEMILSLGVSKGDDRDRIVHGKLETNVLGNVLNADQVAEPLVRREGIRSGSEKLEAFVVVCRPTQEKRAA